MSKLAPVTKLLSRLWYFGNFSRLLRKMGDKQYLKLLYFVRLGKSLNLDVPTTYNEKIQWLKLNDRNPIYPLLVDKHEVKDWVAQRIGPQYVVPTLGLWDSYDEIDFDMLPNQFVLKCTHDSGGLVLCPDKSLLNHVEARQRISDSLSRNYFYAGREWPYKDVKPRILAEVFLSPQEDSPTEDPFHRLEAPADYKFFCFAGQVQAFFVATGRSTGDTRFDFFDTKLQHQQVTNGYPNADHPPQLPENIPEMMQLAETLSEDFPHVRVDFYSIQGRIYFGELTFHHFNGLVPFYPKEYDEFLGSWIPTASKE